MFVRVKKINGKDSVCMTLQLSVVQYGKIINRFAPKQNVPGTQGLHSVHLPIPRV